MSYQLKENSIIVLKYIESIGKFKNMEIVCFVSSEFPIVKIQSLIDRKQIFAREATKLEQQVCFECMECNISKDCIGFDLSGFDQWLNFKKKQFENI